MDTSDTLLDPDFGRMTFNGGQWELERSAKLGDRLVPIAIEPEDRNTGAISALQREAVRQALALPPDILRTAAPVVLQNYDVYREALGDEELPPLDDDPIQVWQEVTFTNIVVPPHNADGSSVPRFLLMAECSWDPEHGLVVRFVNGSADEADQQGELG